MPQKNFQIFWGQWTGEYIQPDDIAILSPKKYKDSICRFLPPQWRERIAPIESEKSMPRGKLTYSTIPDFKGLEKKFVAIVDLDVIYEESHLNSLLYIAMDQGECRVMDSHESKRARLHKQKPGREHAAVDA